MNKYSTMCNKIPDLNFHRYILYLSKYLFKRKKSNQNLILLTKLKRSCSERGHLAIYI